MYSELNFLRGLLRSVAGVALIGFGISGLLSCNPAPQTKTDADEIDPPPPVYSFIPQNFSNPFIPESLTNELAPTTRIYLHSLLIAESKIQEFRENLSTYINLDTWVSTPWLGAMGNQFANLVLASNITFSYKNATTLQVEYTPLAGAHQGSTFSEDFEPFAASRIKNQTNIFPYLTPQKGEKATVFLVAYIADSANYTTPHFYYALNLDTLEQSILTRD
jgi:hypothetical protein